jgi:histidinol-phosphate aminotransferase
MMPLRTAITGMPGYTPGEQLNSPDLVKLNTNENPYPPSPKVCEALHAAITSNTLRKYPDPTGLTLRMAAAAVIGVQPEQILIGNGSDDLLTIITRATVPEGGVIASPTPSYILYQTLADIQGATLQLVPFSKGWSLPKPWPFPKAHLTIVPNPNSPSGTLLRLSEIEHLAKSIAGLLVLDEAYVEFAETSGVELLHRLPNLVITRTFSKYYGLAGIRCGLAMASPELIKEFTKVKDSYNVDALAQCAAATAILDQSYYSDTRAKILASRGRMTVALSELGFHVTPSTANFVWCQRSDRPVKPIYEALRAKNILVRYMNYKNYGDGLRISVGTPAEVERLLAALHAIIIPKPS